MPTNSVEHSIAGVWWLKDSPEHRFPGTLFLDDGMLSIIVHDHSWHPPPGPIAEDELIYGEGDEAGKYTLAQCTHSASRGAVSGPLRHDFKARLIFRGLHLPSFRGKHFTSIDAGFIGLQRWLETPPSSVKHLKNPRNFDVKVRFRAIKLQVRDDLELILYSRYGIPFAGDFDGKASIEPVGAIAIRTRKESSFDKLAQELKRFQAFLSFSGGYLALPEAVQASGPLLVPESKDDKEAQFRASVIQEWWYSSSPGFMQVPPHPGKFLFRQADLQERLENTLRSWYETMDRLQSVLDLYMAAKFGRTFIESRFLALCQAIEGFHRSELGGTYMEPKAYQEEVLPRLIKGIPPKVPQDLRKALRVRMNYGNEVSLRRRIREVARYSIPKAALNPKSLLEIVEQVVGTRNGWIHQLTGRPPEDRELNVMMQASDCLEGLLELALLRILGFPEDKLISQAWAHDGTRMLAR